MPSEGIWTWRTVESQRRQECGGATWLYPGLGKGNMWGVEWGRRDYRSPRGLYHSSEDRTQGRQWGGAETAGDVLRWKAVALPYPSPFLILVVAIYPLQTRNITRLPSLWKKKHEGKCLCIGKIRWLIKKTRKGQKNWEVRHRKNKIKAELMKKQPKVQQRGPPKPQDGSLKMLKQTSSMTDQDKKGVGINKHY